MALVVVQAASEALSRHAGPFESGGCASDRLGRLVQLAIAYLVIIAAAVLGMRADFFG
jgi:hypothetical protein